MNAHKSRARRKKVDKLTTSIWEGLPPEDRRDDATVEVFATMKPAFRAQFAAIAGVLPPSDETWAMVVEWLRNHVRWAQQDSAA